VDAAAANIRHLLRGRTLQVDADSVVEVEIDPKLTSAALAHILETRRSIRRRTNRSP